TRQFHLCTPRAKINSCLLLAYPYLHHICPGVERLAYIDTPEQANDLEPLAQRITVPFPSI
ncbi:hypothetical protein JVW21_21015, partial [Vibrio cholerae O1]|uniref:hypothetical protein n=1 Tax=Vibrio cholerae TaxID=666 RepID=UPI001C126754